LEDELLAETHKLRFMEHLIWSSVSDADHFESETDGMKARFDSYGKLRMPWLEWGPKKGILDLYRESRERRKDPAYMARLKQMQAELDGRAREIAQAVETELEVRKQSVEHRVALAEKARRVIRRRRGRVYRRRPRSIR
jgi:hypothetical protein